MNEKEDLEYTKEDLLSYIKIMKKLDRVSNKDNIVEQLRLCVNRVLDCNQYLRDLEKQYNKSRKLINKYAKQYKKEKDIKKYIKDSDNRIADAVRIRFWAVFDLMNIVETILCDNYNIDLFRYELPSYQDWYSFELKDMIFVNTFIKGLETHKRDKLDIGEIFFELDYAMKEYIDCIEDGYDYKELYGDDDFINIMSKQIEETEEQEDKDE